jgi:hypothetical protein
LYGPRFPGFVRSLDQLHDVANSGVVSTGIELYTLFNEEGHSDTVDLTNDQIRSIFPVMAILLSLMGSSLETIRAG